MANGRNVFCYLTIEREWREREASANGNLTMHTSKQTVITLDTGDEIVIRTRRHDGTEIKIQISARGGDEEGDPGLLIQTDEVVWLTYGPGEEIETPDFTNDRTALLGEFKDLTITVV